MKDIDHHCGSLCNLIIKSTEYFCDKEEWQRPLVHLKVASGLKSLDYDCSRFDDSVGWCGPADIFLDHQDLLEKTLVLELCRFHFIWSALEAAIDISVQVKDQPEIRGKINKTCAFIKDKNIEFDAYLGQLENLEEVLKKDSIYREIVAQIDTPKHVNIYGKGVYLAYRLRNRLAHGALDIPLTMQEKEQHFDAEIVRCLSRLTLFTIQILAIIDFEEAYSFFVWDYVEMPIRLALTNIQEDIHPEDLYPEFDEAR